MSQPSLTTSPELNIVKEDASRIKSHDFSLNVKEQVDRKVHHAGKVPMKFKVNEEEIKIKPNSGCFKAIYEEVLNLKVGDKIKGTDAIATVRDKHAQTDINKIPYLVKTEFLVENLDTGETGKAVLHTYLTQTYFMIQGNKKMKDNNIFKDFFFNNIIKQFVKDIMEKRGQDICFINNYLKSQTKTVDPKQWKRKQIIREDKCDLCSRTFANKQGVNIHKKKIHGISVTELKKTRATASLKINSILTKTDSVRSESGGSRSNSPPPKKNKNIEKKDENKVEEVKKKDDTNIEDRKKEGNMEHSGGNNERPGDQKVDFSTQCNINETEELREVK